MYTGYNTLDEADNKPRKITCYCEQRDPDFDEKMHNVLLIYKQIEFQFDSHDQILTDDGKAIHVLSYDEKRAYRRSQPHLTIYVRMKTTAVSAGIINIGVSARFCC